MRKILLLLMAFGLAANAFAQDQSIKMKDVPDDHWAAAAVYDLIKLGVTKGYPDGTYRGNKPITRYETALFLSKLALAISSEANYDIKALRDEVADLKAKGQSNSSVYGSYQGDWKAGNLLASKGGARGTVGSYRLVVGTEQNMADNAKVKINLDTMDYGYYHDVSGATNSSNGAVASELLDVQSNLKTNLGEQPVDLSITYGRGPKQHVGDPTRVLPSEVGVVYMRPNTGVEAATKLYQADFSLGYHTLQDAFFNETGRVQTSQVSGSLAFNLFNTLRLALSGDYLAHGLISTTDRDLRAKVAFSLPLGDKIQASTTVGLGDASRSGMMVSGSLALNDLWDTGTFAVIQAAKIGSNYINSNFAGEEFYFAGLDNFDRPLVPGTVQLGGSLTQQVSDKVKLVGRGDLRLNGDYSYSSGNGRLTAEGGISYNIAPNADFDAAYRVNQDKSTGDTSDLAAVGLMYKF